MGILAYHASHEQFSPSTLLNLTILAEKAGFTGIHCSDHFQPWSKAQGQSGFSFTWLGAAMQATQVPFGIVCAPGQRYHPAIIAQAVATIGEMFEDRFWLALGSGEYLNEHITGEPWPSKAERNDRLLACNDIIRRLLKGESVTHYGKVVVDEAKLYTLPKKKIPIIGAAISAQTAKWMASWADGLITVSQPYKELKEVVKAFRENGGEGKPMYLKIQFSYAESSDLALNGAYEQWKNNLLDPTYLSDVASVEQFDLLGRDVSRSEVLSRIRVSADINDHLNWIYQDLDLGFNHLIFHNVNTYQEKFIEDFGQYILPQIKFI
ncbi:MAG TPA: TIGR03885 family FMN-dependent LLM class oxidoreductase [Pseudosphingobacterium sp.]|nr:TIGR03885 family FMN-dependent LLM class oxidoreductase [Pseudosphingobacterium sp.]